MKIKDFNNIDRKTVLEKLDYVPDSDRVQAEVRKDVKCTSVKHTCEKEGMEKSSLKKKQGNVKVHKTLQTDC